MAARMSSRTAASSHAMALKASLNASVPRLAVVCRAGFDESAPARRNYQGFEDDFEEDFAATSRPASRPSYGGQQRQGNYAQRGEGGNAGGQRPYRPYQQQQRRQYNNNNSNSTPGGGEEGQGAGQYRPRRQYNNNNFNNNSGGEGQGNQEGGYRQRRPFNNRDRRDGQDAGGGEGGRREFVSPEELARRTEVNAAVKNARDWHDISAVLSQYSDRLDGETVSSMFSKMVKEQRPEGEAEAEAFDQVLRALLGWVLALAPTPNFRPKHTAFTLLALGRMQLYSPEVVEALVARAAQQMVSFQDQDLSYVITGISSLNHVPSPEFVEQFFSVTGNKLSYMRLNELSKLLQNLVKLGVHTSATTAWLEACMAAVTKASLTLAESEADNRAAQAARQEAEKSRSRQQQQSRNRWPFVIRPHEYVELLLTVTTIVRDTGVQVPQETVDALLTRQTWRIPQLGVDQCTTLLWVASTLPTRPAPQWVAGVDRHLASKNWSWQPEDVSQQCLYLSRYLQFRASPMLCGKLSQFWMDRKNDLGVEGLANILYLYAVSGFIPEERWLDTALIYIKDQLPVASLSSLELIYNALPQLSSGFRLNEVVAMTGERYNELAAAQQVAADDQGMAPEEAAAAVA